MELTVSEVKQAINSLPSGKREEIRDWLNEEEGASDQKHLLFQDDAARQERRDGWLKANREKYMNQWVCLDGDNLIANGSDGKKVYRQAKEKGIEVPFMHHIVEESDWGGW